jgi:hypothetical protein
MGLGEELQARIDDRSRGELARKGNGKEAARSLCRCSMSICPELCQSRSRGTAATTRDFVTALRERNVTRHLAMVEHHQPAMANLLPLPT